MLAERDQLVEVVARRRQDDAEDQIAVAVGEVLDLGKERPRREHRRADQTDHDGELARDAALEPGVDVHDESHERSPEPVQGADETPRLGGRLDLLLGQDARAHGRDERHRDDQRESHRAADRQRDVPKELPRLLLHEQDGQKDRERGQCRGQDGAPDLLRSLDGRAVAPLALLDVPVDVLEHDHGVVDEHADGECESREADDVQGTAHELEQQEGPDDARGDGQRDDQRGPRTAQEQEQDQDRQAAADHDVLVDEAYRRVDVLGLVVDLLEDQAVSGQGARVQLGRSLADAVHDVEDVGARLAQAVHRQNRRAEVADDAVRLLVAELHGRHVADIDGPPVAAGEQDGFDLFGAVELPERPDDVAPLALPEVAGGGVLVARPQGAAHVLDRDPARRQFLGIDDDLQLLFGAAEDVGVRDAGDPLHPRLDDILREPAARVHVDVGREELAHPLVFLRCRQEPSHAQAALVGAAGRLEDRRELGPIRLDLSDLFGRLDERPQDEPRDGLVRRVGRAQDRLIRLFGILAHLLQARVHLQERRTHVDADVELEREPADAIHALAGHLAHPLDALELLLLLLDDLALDLLRARAGPARLDGDRRDLHLRCELHGHANERDGAEERDQEDADRDLDGVLDAGLEESHAFYSSRTRTFWFGRKRSLPRVTTREPALSSPETWMRPSWAMPSSTGTRRTVSVLSSITKTTGV